MTYGLADDNYREHRLLVSLRFGWIQRGEHNLTVMNIVKIAAALQAGCTPKTTASANGTRLTAT